MAKNYYVILGISSNTTQTDIKAAYRRLAKEFHPDYYGQNNAPFQIIHEAYSVLSDPKSRRSYDDSIQSSTRKQQAQHAEPVRDFYRETVEPLVPDENTTSFAGRSPRKTLHHFWSAGDRMYDDRYSGTFKGHRQRENIPFKGITIEVTLSPAQAQRGGAVRLRIPVQVRCPSCSGYAFSRYNNCRRCNGEGILPGEKTIMLRYPAGIRDNQMLQFMQESSNTGKSSITAFFRIR